MSDLFGDCPTWLNEELWKAYCDWRASLPKKQRMTSYARVLILNELSRLKAQGHNPDECLRQSLMNCWLGVFPVRRLHMDQQAQPSQPVHPASSSVDQVLGPRQSPEEIKAALRRARERGVLQ